MISKGFYVWTSDDRFKNLSPIEIFINSNGGITLCEESDDNMPIELQSLIALSPDMVDDVIEALRVLKARLYQLEIEKHEKKLAEIKGEQVANEWGSQIRNYVMHPYSLVKDVRTGYETSQVQDVLDGKLDEFIFAYLKSQIK